MLRKCLLICLLFTSPILASLYIPFDNVSLREDIEYLHDHNQINIPISTWPLPWKTLIQALEANQKTLADNQIYNSVYKRIMTQYNLIQKGAKQLSVAYQGHEDFHFKDEQLREGAGLTLQTSLLRSKLHFNLGMAATHSPSSNQSQLWADNTYLGAGWGNWTWSLGMIPHYWGPSTQSGLLLSNNAHPFPALNIDRALKKMPYFKSHWHWSAFMGLQDKQDAENLIITGGRMLIKPGANFEFGLSGIKQIKSFSGVKGYLKGLGEHLIEENKANADYSANFIYGIDLRWQFTLNEKRGVLYGEFVGDDGERQSPLLDLKVLDNGRKFLDPTAHQVARLIGFKYYLSTEKIFHLEHASTFPTRLLFNPYWMNDLNFYKHNIGPGYTHKGRSLGHSIYSNSIMDALGMTHKNDKRRYTWMLRRTRLQVKASRAEDGQFVSPANRPKQEEHIIYGYEQRYTRFVSPAFSYHLNLGLQYWVDKSDSTLIWDDHKSYWNILTGAGLSIHF